MLAFLLLLVGGGMGALLTHVMMAVLGVEVGFLLALPACAILGWYWGRWITEGVL